MLYYLVFKTEDAVTIEDPLLHENEHSEAGVYALYRININCVKVNTFLTKYIL